MTTQEKQDLRMECHKVADIQADSLIKAMESLEQSMPDATPTERQETLKQILKLSLDGIKAGTKELDKELDKKIKDIKLEDLNVR